MLSPSNKLQDVTLYRNKRLDLLTSGVVFVELDYLHESPPTISQIPSYARGRRRQPSSPNAHPYHIIVIDPRPELMKGKAYNYHFAVDEPLPLVTLPLNAGDTLLFDFGAPYHKTLVETFFAYEHVDYTELPLNFDHYSEADQARIVARMVAVLEAALAGIDLEAGPFPVTPMALADGLARIDMLKNELTAMSIRQSPIST